MRKKTSKSVDTESAAPGSKSLVIAEKPSVAQDLAKGFSLLPEVQFGTRGLNCFKNDRNADLERLNKTLKSRHKLVIDGGYGKLKGKTFRISNMGDETDATIATLIAALDDSFAEQGM